MIGRLLHKTDFERLLAVPPCSGSAHFALHHLCARPAAQERRCLSTGREQKRTDSVDNSPDRHWLGHMVPKRHARRAVTRNLLRRQSRAAMQRHLPQLPPGLWLVRLRRPFATPSFRSADSMALRQAAAAELDRLFSRLVP
jgi:ribonuclease P protein component